MKNPDLVSMKFCCFLNLYPIEGTTWLTAFDHFFAHQLLQGAVYLCLWKTKTLHMI